MLVGINHKLSCYPETAQSLTMTLEPVFPQAEGELPSGTLRIAWGEVELSTDWRVVWPVGR